jgi:hypothetical protein
MNALIKKNFKGRIWRKPKDVDEFYEDILCYL